MKLEDFDYQLPEGRIAQEPCTERDRSRMMIVDRQRSVISHSVFYTLPEYLHEGDVLVVNNSRVIPARLSGKKETGGTVEVFLLSRRGGADPSRETWEALVRPAKSIRPGMIVQFAHEGRATVSERVTDRKWRLDFTSALPFDRFLELAGTPPLPPYIKRDNRTQDAADRERYQTIYARIPGSVAAPTAGLHFSPAVMASLESRGVPVVPVTLHVGYGTFRPVEADEVEDHRMEEEHYEIGDDAARIINGARRVIAVGTTSTRTLEGSADERGKIQPGSSATDLFITPGYRFKRVGALLTNFHLPKSTLYMLVCAFAGRDLIREAYRQAIAEQYRFYSYGDCMFII